MITAIGDNPWIVSAKKYLWPIIKKYFNDNGHNAFIIEDSEIKDYQHPSWLWLNCHKILPNYEYILTWDLDIVPVNLSDDIFSVIDTTKISALVEPSYAKWQSQFPHFKYNMGLCGVPKAYSQFFESIYQKYKHNPFNWPSYEQYYNNMEIGQNKIEVQELPRRYASYLGEMDNPTCIHYTAIISKDKALQYFKGHYDAIFKQIVQS